jgi:hypothetical protein
VNFSAAPDNCTVNSPEVVQGPLVICSVSRITPPDEPGTRVSWPWQPSDGYSVLPVAPPPCRVMMMAKVGVLA